MNYYTSLLLPIHNISFIIVLIVLYTALCYKDSKMSRMINGKIDKMQVEVRIVIRCTSTVPRLTLICSIFEICFFLEMDFNNSSCFLDVLKNVLLF